MAVRYIVELTDEERHQLKEIISKNKANRNAIVNAYILLSSPYTFFLLNGDIELYRNRHLFI